MKRREFIMLLGGAALAWPVVARAQPSSKVFRIGYLSSYSAESGKALLVFRTACANLVGWKGENVNFDYRWSGGAAAPLPTLAQDLVSTNPDVIVVASTPGSRAVHKATSQIPVVFVGVSDPVASGIVASLARPGGNITGVSNFLPATAGKLLELLRTVVPTAARFAVLRDPNNAGKQQELSELRIAARDVGAALEAADARSLSEIDNAFSTIGGMDADALIVLLDGVTLTARPRIVEWATNRRLPTIFQIRDFVAAGGLMSYGLNFASTTDAPRSTSTKS